MEPPRVYTIVVRDMYILRFLRRPDPPRSFKESQDGGVVVKLEWYPHLFTLVRGIAAHYTKRTMESTQRKSSKVALGGCWFHVLDSLAEELQNRCSSNAGTSSPRRDGSPNSHNRYLCLHVRLDAVVWPRHKLLPSHPRLVTR